MTICFACGRDTETRFYQDDLVSGPICIDGDNCMLYQEAHPAPGPVQELGADNKFYTKDDWKEGSK